MNLSILKQQIDYLESQMAERCGMKLYKSAKGFTQEEIYTYAGAMDCVATLTLSQESARVYGETLTVTFVYYQKERMALEKDKTALNDISNVKAKELLGELDSSLHAQLLKDGVPTKDIVEMIVGPETEEQNDPQKEPDEPHNDTQKIENDPQKVVNDPKNDTQNTNSDTQKGLNDPQNDAKSNNSDTKKVVNDTQNGDIDTQKQKSQIKNVDKMSIKDVVVDKMSINNEIVDKFCEIIVFVTKNPHAKTEQIAQLLGMSNSSAKQYMQKLTTFGFMSREGANKNRTYSVSKELLGLLIVNEK